MNKLMALLLTLLAVIPLFVGCSNNANNPANTKSGETAAETDPYDDGVPDDLDYEGRVFTIGAPWPDNWGMEMYDRTEQSGDTINDAIYNRNRSLEKRFNITIEAIQLGETGSQASEFAKYVLNNEDIIDMIAVGYYQSGKPLIMEGYLLPWNDVPYIKTEKSWWNNNIIDSLSILGNSYLLVGDVNWFSMAETPVCYFNKTVAGDNPQIVGDLYQTVKNQEWTFNKLYTIAKDITKDLNGDNKFDTNDRYGCIQNTIIGVTGFVYAANYHTVIVTDEGPQLQFNTDKMVDIISWLVDLCRSDNISYTETFDFTEDSKGIPMFFNDQALFYFDILMHAETFRQYEREFGIIPYPKYDEAQEQYTSYCNQWGLACGLPSTSTNHERTGAILEAMCALSAKNIVPQYYDRVLKGRYTRDYESEDMLDLIFSNVIYDFGISFCTDLSYIPAKTFVERNNKNVASWFKSQEKKLEKNYQELFDYVAEIKNSGGEEA